MSKEFLLKTVEKIGVIRENDRSAIELRITEVNGQELFDIRSWYNHNGEERATKGIRLDANEMITLIDLFYNYMQSEQD